MLESVFFLIYLFFLIIRFSYSEEIVSISFANSFFSILQFLFSAKLFSFWKYNCSIFWKKVLVHCRKKKFFLILKQKTIVVVVVGGGGGGWWVSIFVVRLKIGMEWLFLPKLWNHPSLKRNNDNSIWNVYYDIFDESNIETNILTELSFYSKSPNVPSVFPSRFFCYKTSLHVSTRAQRHWI